MDRASDYGSEGWGFESLRGHQIEGRLKMKFETALIFLIGLKFLAPVRENLSVISIIDKKSKNLYVAFLLKMKIQIKS